MHRRVGKGTNGKAMETQNEDSTEPSSSIPLDVTIGILLRLPAESVARFRCVSKLWSFITSTQNFIKTFTNYSSTRPCILSVSVRKEEGGKRVCFSLPHKQDPKNPYTRVEKCEMMSPKHDSSSTFIYKGYIFDVHDSVRGLISLENFDCIIIWNPTLRQHVTLPQPRITKPLISLLGYDPIADEHKVLCMTLCRENGQDPQIFTLGAQERWRKAKSSPIHPSMKSWKCINGVLYYYGVDHSVVSFDVRSEKSLIIKRPDFGVTLRLPSPKHNLISYNGRLGWIYDGFRSIAILWILKDVEKQEWSVSVFEIPFFRYPPGQNMGSEFLKFSGDTGDDELIYTPLGSDGPFCAFYYDLKKDITRKVTYEGIDDKWYRHVWFPNHIESLKSLNI